MYVNKVDENQVITPNHATNGPDRLELIIFDITGKKIDNDPCRLIISF